MAGAVAQRKEDTLSMDKDIIWNIVKKAQDGVHKMTRSMVEIECAYIPAKEQKRFDVAFKALVDEGRIRKTDEKIKVGSTLGIPRKENVLEAVTPTMKNDIEKVRHSEISD